MNRRRKYRVGIRCLFRNRALVLAAFACMLAVGGPMQAHGYICGDANDDGVITISDIVFLAGYIFRAGPPPAQIEASDINCNGGIDIGDAVFLIRYIFDDGPAPCSECPPIDQYILFEVCISTSWPYYSLEGMYVNSLGQTITYRWGQPSIELQWYEKHYESELLYRYSVNPELCRTIPRDELYAMYQLIEPASEGQLSDRVAGCMDFGGSIFFVAYTYDADSSLYRPVLLEVGGSMAQKNLAPEAEQLVEWLEMCGYHMICGYWEDQ